MFREFPQFTGPDARREEFPLSRHTEDPFRVTVAPIVLSQK